MKQDNLLSLSDEELVAVVLRQDRDAYRELVARYQEKLARYVRTFTRDEAVIADAVQESFINAYLHLAGFRQGAKFSSWIYRITHNVAFNYFLRKQRDLHFPEGMDFPSDENVSDEFEHAEIDREVHLAIAQLPQIYAAPLTLHAIEGHSYEEVSSILGLPLGTVGTRINRAKRLLKQICQKNASLM